MPNTVVTKQVTHCCGQHRADWHMHSPPSLLSCISSHPCLLSCTSSSPHLLSCTSSPPLLHLGLHQTGIQDLQCHLWVTLSDWFHFLGALQAPWPVQVFLLQVLASTGFLSPCDLSSTGTGTGFLISFSVFCTDYGEYVLVF